MHRAIFVALVIAVAAPAVASDSCSLAYSDGGADLRECRQLAEAGNPDAQFGLALVLWSGIDRAPDRKDALDWFRAAARQGHLLSQVALGRFLTVDEVIPELRNRPEGYAWWVVAGERDAAANLRSTFTASELVAGERLAQEFQSQYGAVH